MASTDVFVCYGIFVSTRTFLSASLAYPKLVAPLQGLDLLLNRRRQGVLKSTSAAIEAAPDDVWESIRDALVRQELDEAERALGIEFRCPNCAATTDDTSTFAWSSLWGTDCTMCRHLWWNYEGFAADKMQDHASWFSTCSAAQTKLMAGSFRQAFMLARYGLAAPANRCFSRNRGDVSGDWLTEHPESGMLIAIPHASTAGQQDGGMRGGFASVDYGEPGHDRQRDAVADLSFHLPHDADERFCQFISDWQIDVVDLVDAPMHGPFPPSPPKRSFAAIPRAEARPRWRICVNSQLRP